MGSIKYSALLLAGVGAAAAFNINDPFGSTGTCQSTLLNVSSNSEASSCLNVPGLAAILTLPANSSVVPSLNTWLQGMCRASPCSNATINAITTNITNGCQSDISNTGIGQSTLQTIIQDVPRFYPTIRSIACLKTASNDTLCASSTLLDVESFVGQPLSAENAMDAISQIAGHATSLPANLTCTGCTQAAFDTFQADEAMLAANPAVQSVISQQCGANFLTASQPSDVVEGTASAAPTGVVGQNLNHNAAPQQY
ncbi:hypothetical protein JB92DRAFT_2914788 [Gautieria morchelliformis]|nr:hypothetical protein JB92DRAFT_2914788 [Gautieria morchelliformis]